MREANNVTIDIESVKSSTKRINDIEDYFGLGDEERPVGAGNHTKDPILEDWGWRSKWSPEAPKVSHRMCPSLDLTGQRQAQAICNSQNLPESQVPLSTVFKHSRCHH